MTVQDITKFEVLFDNIPVFKEHPIWTVEHDENNTPFSSYRPEYQIRDVNTNDIVCVLFDPYGNEKRLAPFADRLSAEQITMILDRTYSHLFQDGTPHVSWNTDRHYIMMAIIKEQGTIITSKSWDETWTYNTCTWYKLKCGLTIKEIVEEPRSYSLGARLRYRYTIVEDNQDVPNTPTHIAISFYSDGYDDVHINKHFSGTHDECVEWIRKYCKTNLWAILDVETYRKNYMKKD